MTYSELVNETMAMVQDSSKYDDIRSYVNMALQELTAVVALPEFKAAASVDTLVDTPYVALQVLPDRYVGGILKLYGESVKGVKIYATLDDMIDSEDISDITTVGTAIEAVAVEGSNIWYYPMPEVPVTLSVLYYTTHPRLYADDEAVTLFPDYIQRQAVCSSAAAMCFEKIEDGLDGEKINTAAYRLMAKEGIQKFREWATKNKKHFISSVWSA